MFPDGLCRLEGGTFSKTIAFEDVNYRLTGPEDQRSIFESLCDFYNGYDPTIGVQVTLDSRSGGSAADEMFGITRQGNDLDPIRDEAVDILRMQYKRGNNGYVKTKYVTLTIEAENLPAARARFARIETDTLNRFKVMRAAAHVLDGKERLELLYNILHPEGGQFRYGIYHQTEKELLYRLHLLQRKRREKAEVGDPLQLSGCAQAQGGDREPEAHRRVYPAERTEHCGFHAGFRFALRRKTMLRSI